MICCLSFCILNTMKQKTFLLLLSMVMMGISAFFLVKDWQPFVEEESAEPLGWITVPVAEFQKTESVQTNFGKAAEETLQTAEDVPQTETETVTRNPITTKSPKQTNAKQVQSTVPEQEVSAFVISYPLDLNTSSVEELETLPAIGSILAQRIVSYREMMGGFSSLQELLQVNGIGMGIYEQISPYLFIKGGLETIVSESEALDSLESGAELPTNPIPILDINTATAVDFQQLPGVTPAIAENIVQLRTLIQYFQNVYELLYANGMTDELFLSIRDYLYVNVM